MSLKSSLNGDSEVSGSGKKYSLRPLARTIDESTLEGAFRVHMATADINREQLKPGDFISLRNEGTGATGIAIVARAVDNGASGSHKSNMNPVIRMSEWLREKYSFELKDRYHVEKWNHKFRPIEKIVVTNVTESEPVSIDSVKFWTPVALGE
jgi:AAA family ATPase